MMRRLALLPLLALLAVGCASPPTPGPNLPNGEQAQALGLRAVWTAFQDAVRDGDADRIAALWSADAPAVETSGADGDELAETILMVVQDPDLRQAILTTRAQDLRVDGQMRTFAFEQRSVDPEDGTEYESGVYVRFTIDPSDANAYLVSVHLAG